MEISGLSYFNAYFQYTSNAATDNAETSPKVTAVSSKMESVSTKAANASAIDIYQVSKSSASYPSFADVLSTQYKMDSVDAYQKELEDAKINDPEKYQKMILESKEAAAKSFSQVAEIAESNGGTATYNGVNIFFDFELQQMNVGDTSEKGSVITVGLSNGWVLNFNTDNIDDISKMLDMFSPEDIKRIMEAITKHNIAVSTQKEIDDAKASVATETADTAVQTSQRSAAESATGESALGGSSGSDEEPEVTTEIVTNPDGSRKLVITTKIGDTETVTNIKLAPAEEENKLLKNQSYANEGSKVEQVSDDTESERTSDSNRTEQSSGLQQATAFQRPTEFQSMHALNAYEANFMYAS